MKAEEVFIAEHPQCQYRVVEFIKPDETCPVCKKKLEWTKHNWTLIEINNWLKERRV